MMALRSLRCIRFSSQIPHFHNWEQGLQFMIEMEEPFKEMLYLRILYSKCT